VSSTKAKGIDFASLPSADGDGGAAINPVFKMLNISCYVLHGETVHAF